MEHDGWGKNSGEKKLQLRRTVQKKVGLDRILIWPDNRLNSNVKFFFRNKCTFIYLSTNLLTDLLYINIILFVITIDLKSFSNRISGYLAGYWI